MWRNKEREPKAEDAGKGSRSLIFAIFQQKEKRISVFLCTFADGS
jgi:hypothetical protein